ncbi:hypothetical protein MASR1M74_27770 [Lentimicrobium sp.]
MRFIFLFGAVLLLCATGISQETNLAVTEAQLKLLLDSTRTEKNDSTRLALNREFYDKLYNAVMSDPQASYPFDSLYIGKPASEDGKVRLFNWNIQQNNGQNIYFLIIHHIDLNKVFRMAPIAALENVENNRLFTNMDWPGGLIYKVIYRNESKKPFYTLLSWDGFSRSTLRKSVDILSFDNEGNPVFGLPVFKTRDGIQHRVVKEYSSEARFTLIYDKQSIKISNVRKSKRKLTDYMIILDKLIPLNESLVGEYWAYVPAGDTYDAYVFLNQYWTFVEDIAPRNPSVPKTKAKKVEYDLFPAREPKTN